MSWRLFFGVSSALVIAFGTGTLFGSAAAEEQSKMQIELHFTEGFSGEEISILVEGRIVAEFSAQTKLQTGLAHIEMLDLPDGEEVVVNINRPKTSVHLDVDASHPFVTFALQDGVLLTRKTDLRPGYV